MHRLQAPLSILRTAKSANYSAVIFGISIAAAIYGYFNISILLLLLSGVTITKESIRLREPDYIFIAFISLFFLISIASAYGRDAYREYLPLGFAYALSAYIFLIIKANYQYFSKAINVVTLCFIVSSFDLILRRLVENEATSLDLIEQSITAAFIVPNDYALFVIVMPLFSYSIKFLPVDIKNWLIPFMYITGLFTAVSLSSRLCLLLLVISLIFEYRLYARFIRKKTVALLVMITVFSVTLTPDFFYKLQSLPTSRIPLWDAAIHQVVLHPWLGMGLDSFSNFYASHISTSSYYDFITVDRRLIPWPHNIFLEISASFGLIVGTLFAVGITFLFSKTNNQPDHLVSSIRSTAFLYLIAGLFELTYLRIYPFLIFVLLASVQVAHKSNKELLK